MKKLNLIIFAPLLFLASILPVIYAANLIDSPYICSECETPFASEAQLINHMKTAHEIDIQLEGEWPEYIFQTHVKKQHLPELYYICPYTGVSFVTEAALMWWMEKQ